MGRTGGGTSSHSRPSSSGRSVSRSSGGHRVGSTSTSRRTGSSSSSSFTSSRPSSTPSSFGGSSYSKPRPPRPTPPPAPPFMAPPPPPRTHYHRHPTTVRVNNYYGNSSRRYDEPSGNSGRSAFVLIVSLAMIFTFILALFFIAKSANQPKNDTPRVKLETHNAFDNDCIDDQLDWFENTSKAARGLKDFWDETGVQPYIVMKDDDGTLMTDSQKDAWAEDYYETLGREDAFLYVYFYEEGEEYSDIPSYMCYVNGYETSSVMDAEAVSIFWGYIDRYWVTDMSTDDVFVEAFTKTGNTIMHVSTTGKDIIKWIIVMVVVLIIGIVLISLSKTWFKDRRAKAEEDARILSTPVEKIKDSTTNDLESKYLD